MLKKTITYTDYNGVERTEDFYFNLTRAELMEMHLTTDGGMDDKINGIIKAKSQKELEKLIPKEKWSDAHHWFIWHGRKICKARKPLCRGCVVVEECPFKEKNFD